MDHIELFNKMIEYYEGNPKRIQHFTKVFEYCRLIGTMENIPEKEQFALETTALVHDIGIKKAEEVHGKGNCSGKLQEKLGPEIAEIPNCKHYFTLANYLSIYTCIPSSNSYRSS